MVATSVRQPGRTFTSRLASRPRSWAPEGEWRLYRAWGDLPRESGLWRRFLAWLLGGWQQLLYVGITGRTAMARWAEHIGDKSWAPDIAVLERDRRVWSSEEDVRAAERAAIIAERPVWNVEHNGNNPGAVRIRRRLPQHVVRSRLRLAVHVCVFVAVFAALLLVGGDVWQGWDAPRNAAAGASVPGVLVAARGVRRWWRRLNPPKRRSSRRGRW